MTELFLLKCAAKAFSINQSTDYICSCAVVVDEMDEVTTIAIAIDFFFFFWFAEWTAWSRPENYGRR